MFLAALSGNSNERREDQTLQRLNMKHPWKM